MGIHKVVIPVAAGRNLAVLLEAAVRNTILKLRGIDTMEDFLERQRRAMDTLTASAAIAAYRPRHRRQHRPLLQ